MQRKVEVPYRQERARDDTMKLLREDAFMEKRLWEKS